MPLATCVFAMLQLAERDLQVVLLKSFIKDLDNPSDLQLNFHEVRNGNYPAQPLGSLHGSANQCWHCQGHICHVQDKYSLHSRVVGDSKHRDFGKGNSTHSACNSACWHPIACGS